MQAVWSYPWGRNALRPHHGIAHLFGDIFLAPAARHLRSPYISVADVGAGGEGKYVLATFLTDVKQLSKMVTKPHYPPPLKPPSSNSQKSFKTTDQFKQI